VEDLRSPRGIEYVRTLEETREPLAISAIADEAKAGVRRDVVRNSVNVAALTVQWKADAHVSV
jgi:hypothetical protein